MPVSNGMEWVVEATGEWSDGTRIQRRFRVEAPDEDAARERAGIEFLEWTDDKAELLCTKIIQEPVV